MRIDFVGDDVPIQNAIRIVSTIYQARTRKMNFTKPFWAGLLPALALYGALLCTSVVSAQEAAPETKKEEPAAAATEAPMTEAPAAATEEKKEEVAAAPAGDPTPPMTEISYAVDNITLFIAAVLVIFMQAGFALVETGLNSSKNA